MKKFNYIIQIQFLGFRYSGWQKQKNAKTVQEMIDKTFFCIFEHYDFKTLGAGRTDSKVSANQFPFQLLVSEELDTNKLLIDLEKNLPADIKALSVEAADPDFSVISQAKTKQYQYVFAFGEIPHPFSAPLVVYFRGGLDIEKMKEGALLFLGEHNFKNYCYKPNENTKLVRTVTRSVIKKNDQYQASFFPKESWIFEVESSGFLRQQIRLMMGALVRLGLGELSIEDLTQSLDGASIDQRESLIVPSSGLILNKVEFC